MILLAVLLATPLANHPAHADEAGWTVEKLMQEFSRVNYARLDFVETKQSIFLIIDTVVKGSMEYRAPDYIEKNTVSPLVEQVVIDGDSMVIRRTVAAGKSDTMVLTRSYSIQSHPLLKATIENIRAILAGNAAMLAKNYILHLQGVRQAWQLSLVPKSKDILDYIASIYLTGAGARIKQVVTTQADGDESTIALDYQLLQ